MGLSCGPLLKTKQRSESNILRGHMPGAMLSGTGESWGLCEAQCQGPHLGPSAAKSNTKVSKSNAMRLVMHNAKENGQTKVGGQEQCSEACEAKSQGACPSPIDVQEQCKEASTMPRGMPNPVRGQEQCNESSQT